MQCRRNGLLASKASGRAPQACPGQLVAQDKAQAVRQSVGPSTNSSCLCTPQLKKHMPCPLKGQNV